MFDNAPLEGATLLLYNLDGRDHIPTVGVTDVNGRFVLRTHGEEVGAYPGTYKVVVTKTVLVRMVDDDAITELATPEKYSLASTTDLVVTIPPNGDKNIVITLQK